MAQRPLSQSDIEAIAKQVLQSDEFQVLLAEALKAETQRQKKRKTNAKFDKQVGDERAKQRREEALHHAEQLRQMEKERGDRLLEMWDDGVPRDQIASALGLSKRAFGPELERLRALGHELNRRPGID